MRGLVAREIFFKKGRSPMITRPFSFKKVNHLASQEDLLFLYKLTMQNIEEFCFVSIVKMGHLLLLIFGPHVLETAYTSFEPSARV